MTGISNTDHASTDRAYRAASPAVSVIVPLWNACEHIDALVGAIKAQTLSNFEAILINGGPNPQSASTLTRAIGNDERFVVLNKENKGAGAARNAGIDIARGDYIAFIDADDHPYPQMLEHSLAHAQKTQADIVVFHSEHLDVSTGQRYPNPDAWDAACFPVAFDPTQYAEDLFGTFRNWPWDKLFCRRFLEQEQLRFPSLMRSEDLPFTCTALASAHRIALLDEVLYTYSVNGTSTATATHSQAPLDIIEGCRLLKAALEQRGLMKTYRCTYTQWAGLACCVGLLQLKDATAFGTIYRELHEGVLHELELDSRTRTWTEQPSGAARSNAAGFIEDEDIWAILGIVEHDDLAEGTFNLLQYKSLQIEREHEDALREYRESYSYRIGKALLAPWHALRGE